jgi:hypothetical protein
MKNKLNNSILILVLSLLWLGCKKDFPSWQGEYLLPIAHGKLKIQDFISDENIQEESDHSLTFILSDTLFQLRLDTLLKTSDTSLVDSFRWTFSALTIAPGQTVFSGQKESVYKVKDIELKRLKIKSGKIFFQIYNTVDEKLLIHYELPKVSKDGQSVEIDRLIDAGSSGAIGYLEDSIDLADYNIDLTGVLGNKVNILLSSYTIKTNPDGAPTVINTGDQVKIVTSIRDLIPYYGSGYLGSNAAVYASSEYLDVFNNISGLIDLEEVDIEMQVQNGLGVDARLTFYELSTENTKTAAQKTLTAPWIGNPVNINRAYDEVPAEGPVHYSTYSLDFNKTNSNIDELLEILPDSLRYDLKFELNPLGNISNGTDFIYLDETVNILMNTRIPLHLRTSGFTLGDTILVDIGDNERTFLENTNEATLHLFATNYFPVQADLSIYFIDQNQQRIGVLSENKILQAANTVGITTTGVQSRLDFVLTPESIAWLRAAKSLYIKASFNTANAPQKVQLYSDQMLDVQFTLDLSQDVP